MVELGSEGVFKADIDSSTHLGPFELVFENKSVTTAIVQTETASAMDLVLRAGWPRRRASLRPSLWAAPGLWCWSSRSPRKFSRRTSTAQRIWGRSSWCSRISR